MRLYFKFEEPNFTFEDENNAASKSLFHIILKIISPILPKANPRFDTIYKDVKYWLIEFEEDGNPSREVGLNASEETIVVGPLGDDRGFWTDNNMKYDEIETCFFKDSVISESIFQKSWDNFYIS